MDDQKSPFVPEPTMPFGDWTDAVGFSLAALATLGAVVFFCSRATRSRAGRWAGAALVLSAAAGLVGLIVVIELRSR